MKNVATPRAARGTVPQGTILTAGLLLVALYVSALIFFMSRTSYDTWGGFFVAPVLVAMSAPVLWREANREGDAGLFRFLVAALLLHLVLAIVGRFMVFTVYHGKADAVSYLNLGAELGPQFRQGIFTMYVKGGIVGNNWSGVVAGVSYAIAGPTNLGAFMFFSWLGFWGAFFFYRAFRVAVPEGRQLTYRRLLFLFPSLAFWSSFLGKDSWMVFGMGIATYGVAKILAGPGWKGLLPFVTGSACILAVRPHIAGMIGVALAFAYLVRQPKVELRELAPVAKLLGLVVVCALAAVLVVRTEHFLSSKGITANQGLTAALSKTSGGSSYGGSAYSPPIVSSPTRLPAAIVTVLFRPLPNEAGSPLEVLVALEMTSLALVALWRWRWEIAALFSVRRQPFVAFCIAYVGMAIVAFSAFANFGLLDRERVQILPIFFVLLAIPPKKDGSLQSASGRNGYVAKDRARRHG